MMTRDAVDNGDSTTAPQQSNMREEAAAEINAASGARAEMKAASWSRGPD